MKVGKFMNARNSEKTVKLELVKTCCRVEELNEMVELATKELKDEKQKLIKIMDMLKIKEHVLPLSTNDEKEIVNVRFCVVTKTIIDYNLQKLKSKIGKNVVNKIIKRKVKINDFDNFRDIMRKYGVPYKELKEVLDIEEKVSTPLFEDQFKKGYINLEEVADCYTLDKLKYIKIQKSR